MDGFEVCKMLKTNMDTKDIPVIFLTAKNDSESIIKGFEFGAVDYVTKPFNYNELLSRIRTHLDLKSKKRLIESMNQLLEKRVHDRTVKLRHANQRLLKIDNAKNDFLSLINHELRTPLNAITGFVDLLDKSSITEKQKDYIKQIKDSVLRLTNLTDIALLITSLRSDKYKINIKPINVKEVIEQATNKIKSIVDEKNVVINTRKLQKDNEISADQKLMIICLENILENAAKFSPKNSEIIIRTNNNQGYYTITIQDDGPGFSDLDKDKLFEFFQTNDIIHHAKGFGLGLAVSKLIMDAHSGKLSIKNKEKKGAVVELLIPKNENQYE
jgi:two-component system sensor histidine kinase/response regulator